MLLRQCRRLALEHTKKGLSRNLRQHRPLLFVAVNSLFQGTQGQHRTFHTHRGQWDPKQIEHVLPSHLLNLVERFPLDRFHEHGSGCQANHTAFAFETDVSEAARVEARLNAHFVSTEGVEVADLERWMLKCALVGRVLVMVQDVVLVHLKIHRRRSLLASPMASSSTLISSTVL